MKQVAIAVVGAGDRGANYAQFAVHYPDRMRVVAVAEPRAVLREQMARRFSIPAEQVFSDWRELFAHDRMADAAIVATPDTVHAEPAAAAAQRGYHVLLEKPMAPTPGDCRRIADAVRDKDTFFAVCHVLRYTACTKKIRELIDAGAIGDIVSIERLEPVGWWHQAHSFVRGNWRNEHESSFMLLAKSCHDLDWIRYIAGVPCRTVASFGSLKHFRREEQPPGAAGRCLDCAIESGCPYSAVKIYLKAARGGHAGWPVSVVNPTDPSEKGVREALRDGPYGRCVYACDNDVVDNQVVIMEFEGGRTASFTMTAFTEMADRKTRIFGTRGRIESDGAAVDLYDFLSGRSRRIDPAADDPSVLGGHGGGDHGLMDHFVRAVAENDRSLILSGVEETLESHLMVFAAEQARRERRTVRLAEWIPTPDQA